MISVILFSEITPSVFYIDYSFKLCVHPVAIFSFWMAQTYTELWETYSPGQFFLFGVSFFPSITYGSLRNEWHGKLFKHPSIWTKQISKCLNCHAWLLFFIIKISQCVRKDCYTGLPSCSFPLACEHLCPGGWVPQHSIVFSIFC